MKLVLDTNEFIGALGIIKNPPCERLFNLLLEYPSKYTLYIPRTILNEVRRNLPPIIFTEFIKAVRSIATIDEDIIVPFEVGVKYEACGLKSADAFIASYTESVDADTLVTENRHFLSRHDNLPFKVMNAKSCLKILGK